jgi:probable phosphoglycerate mutase
MSDDHPDGIAALKARARASGFAPSLERFYFVRHGRTQGNLTKTFQHPEIPLAEEGLQDAESAAAILHNADFTHMLASDMARAWRTAGAISARTGKPVTVERGIRERYFGVMIGRSSVNLDWRIEPAGGETLQGFVDRTVAGIASALASGPTPLLVSHGGVLMVLAYALGVDLNDDVQRNGVPLLVRREAAGWSITKVPA